MRTTAHDGWNIGAGRLFDREWAAGTLSASLGSAQLPGSRPGTPMKKVVFAIWLALLLWFLWDRGPEPLVASIGSQQRVSPESIDRNLARKRINDPPTAHIGGFDQKCSDCHALFASLDVTPGNLKQHGHITHDHGLNDRCFNCHSQEDRNKLVMHDGRKIGFDLSTELCSKCHGTVFRDWQRGMHGKTVGSWDRNDPAHARLHCVECHDPHAPAFGPIELLPAPMGARYDRARVVRDHAGGDGAGGDGAESSDGTPHEELTNPLERWKGQRASAARREALQLGQEKKDR